MSGARTLRNLGYKHVLGRIENLINGLLQQAAPIVRVAVEPADPADIPALVRGLRLLNRADPFVEVLVSGSGEHVIGAAGEVHLERCIRDLQV